MSFLTWAEVTLRSISLGEAVSIILLTCIAVKLARRR